MTWPGGRWGWNGKKWMKLDYMQLEEITKFGCSIIDGINISKKE